MRVETVTCDVCEAVKRDVNHWWIAHRYVAGISLGQWSKEEAERAGAIHLCGQACVHKFMDEYMSAA